MISEFQKKYRQYLPSKKLSAILGAGLIVLITILTINTIANRKGTLVSNSNALTEDGNTVLGMMQTDTDGDGIFDWEEALWGTDKIKKATFDGIPDAQYVESKRQALKTEQAQNDKVLTETELFAREFFGAFVAMQASGKVDEQTINNFSNSLGQNMVHASLIDQYTVVDVRNTTTDDSKSRQGYYSLVKKAFESYESSNLGEELDIINNELILSNGENISKQGQLTTIAKAYQSFAREAISIAVPKSLEANHLKMVNGANNTGISVQNMAKIVNDPLQGLSGLSQYQAYSLDFVEAVAGLEESL